MKKDFTQFDSKIPQYFINYDGSKIEISTEQSDDSYYLQIVPCVNTFCACGEALVCISNARLNDINEEEDELYTIEINVIHEELLEQQQLDSNSEGFYSENKWLNIFENHLEDLNWTLLREIQEKDKAFYVEFEEHDLEDAYLYNLEEIHYKDDSVMLGYSNVFPAAEMFEIQKDDTTYVVKDVYCKALDCSCSILALNIFEKGDFNNCQADIRYDYKEEKMVFHQKNEWQWLIDALILKYPNFHKRLKNRNKQIKDIYAVKMIEYFEENRPKPFIAIEKIGKNDPCPCGSGKKYKKCCL